MANNFLKFKGINVGASLLENGSEEVIKNIHSLVNKNKCNIIIPVDCNVSKNINGNAVYKSIEDINSYNKSLVYIFDIMGTS